MSYNHFMRNDLLEGFIIDPPDEKLFNEACECMIPRDGFAKGIGTLGEKSVHSVLKYYYLPDQDYHEIHIGNYVADACREGEIFEIQSGNFGHLRPKLSAFLPEYEVTVVYPISINKKLIYIDKNDGTMLKPRTSSKHGSPYDAVIELLRIKDYLTDEHLHLQLCLLDCEEYRIYNGNAKYGKRDADKADRIPVKILGTIPFDKPSDYLSFLSEKCRKKLPEEFTSRDVARLSGFSASFSSTLCALMYAAGLAQRTKKTGNAYHYRFF